MSAEKRQEAISALIKTARIGDQKELIRQLSLKFGIETNQAVVSRDLRRLGVVKRGDCYELPEKDIQAEILKLGISSMVHNESLIVISTQPGLAAVVGDYIDQCEDIGILGCIAGENVVFVAPRSIKEIKKIYIDLCAKLHYKL